MAPLYLILPPCAENTPEIYHLSLYCLPQNNQYQLSLPPILQNCRCVGSSHRWLAFLDRTGNPFLLNPFSTTTIINLPPKPKSSSTIQKVVLSKNPLAKTNAVILLLYSLGFRTKIAFCRIGDQQWTDLDYCKGNTYYDIVCCDKTNTVFALGPGPSVESWNLTESTPKKKMMILQHPLEEPADCSDLYSSQWYLATLSGHIFLVMRYIGDFVRYDGEVVYEGDTLTDYAAEPLVCPYKTLDFRVFKLHGDRKMWIRVESLDDFAMFVGGNETAMVSTIEHPELKRNAIYFTDDYWERVDEDYSYGGHDMGIYKLEDGSIHPILDIHQQKLDPPPFWIL